MDRCSDLNYYLKFYCNPSPISEDSDLGNYLRYLTLKIEYIDEEDFMNLDKFVYYIKSFMEQTKRDA